jgi:hypothetical protein
MQKADMAFDRQKEFAGLRPVGEPDIDLAAANAIHMAEQVRPVAEVAWACARKAGA